MSTIGTRLRDARKIADLSVAELAIISGLSRSTIVRCENGDVIPSVNTYLSLLDASGFRANGDDISRTSKPGAIYTVRWLMGDLLVSPNDAEYWLDLWRQLGLMDGDEVTDLESLMFRAGRVAPLGTRPGRFIGRSREPVTSLVGKLRTAGMDYRVAGDEALSAYGTSLNPTQPVFYVENVANAIDILDLRPLESKIGRPVNLIPFDGFAEVGGVESMDGTKFVSATQAILDGFAGYGRMVEQAGILADRIRDLGSWH